MTRTGSIWLLTAALALGGAATPARAQQISDAHIKELIKQAAEQSGRQQPVAADGQQTTTSSRPANSWVNWAEIACTRCAICSSLISTRCTSPCQ